MEGGGGRCVRWHWFDSWPGISRDLPCWRAEVKQAEHGEHGGRWGFPGVQPASRRHLPEKRELVLTIPRRVPHVTPHRASWEGTGVRKEADRARGQNGYITVVFMGRSGQDKEKRFRIGYSE